MKKVAAAALLVLASVALLACGSSSSSSTESSSSSAESGGGSAEKPASGSEGGGSIVKVATPASGELAFTSNKATAKAGQVSIEFENPQELTHNVAVEDSSGKRLGETELVEKGTATTTINLKPGTYTYFCTIPGHRQAGMEGTLTVK
ncbi:MAG: plastocyanin/azurin family copper-binding protein [Solirubrobacterales bacterium]